ncbi:MAG: TolC family protein [Desulfococcaceae bacterium]
MTRNKCLYQNPCLCTLFFILCLLPFSASAITREAAIQYALEKSESMRIVEESAKTVRAEAQKITAFTKPQIGLESLYLEMGDNSDPNPFFETPDRNISAEIVGSQLLFAGGRIWRSLEMEENLWNRADLHYSTGKRDIVKGVKMAFDTVLLEQAVLDILTDRLGQRQKELDDAKDLREAGMVTSLDVRQAMLNLSFAQDALKAEETSYREALIDFNLSLGRSGEEEPWIPEGKLEEIPDMEMLFRQLKTAFSNGKLLDIVTKKNQADGAELSYEIAKGESLPEVALVASAKTEGDDFDETDESWNLGIQLNWNIFDGSLVRAKTASALSELRMADENLKKTGKMIAGEIEKIGISIRSFEERIRLQREAVNLSGQNYQDAREQYRAGTITLTQLGDFSLGYAEARFILQRLFFSRRGLLNNTEALLEDIPLNENTGGKSEQKPERKSG